MRTREVLQFNQDVTFIANVVSKQLEVDCVSRMPGSDDLDFLDSLIVAPGDPWERYALCVERGYDYLHTPFTRRLATVERNACGECEVRGICILAALSRVGKQGVAGGLGERRRFVLRAGLGYPARASEVVIGLAHQVNRPEPRPDTV